MRTFTYILILAALSSTALAHERSWRATLAGSQLHVRDDASAHLGVQRAGGGFASVERRFAGPLSFFLAVEDREGDATLRFRLVDAHAGMSLALPRVFDWLTPYVRGTLVAGYAQLDLAEGVGNRKLVPGVEAQAGMRMPIFGTADDAHASLFLFGEVGASYRLSRQLEVRRIGDGAGERLSGPKTSLGSVNLSAAGWRLGVGLEL